MDEYDIPIFKKIYTLYKLFYGFRHTVSKQDRYTLWQRSEGLILELLEAILYASQQTKQEKLPTLQRASLKLNLLRVFLRICKEVKAIDNRKYTQVEEFVDEIGRMLGGWIRSTKDR